MIRLADRIAILSCALALMFIIIASSVSNKPPEVDAAPLPAVNPHEPAFTGSGFATNAGTPGLTSSVRGVDLYGSRVWGDLSTGTIRTRWYRPVPSFYLLLAGFPDRKRGYIYLELDTRTGLRHQELKLDEDPDYWRFQKIVLQQFRNVTAFRIVANDTSKVSMGWLGFSQPFTILRQDTPEVLKQLLLVILCIAASCACFIGPGLVVRVLLPRAQSTVWLVMPGILFMILLGLFAWKGPTMLSPVIISRVGLASVTLTVGYALTKRSLSSLTTHAERRALGLMLLLVALAVAKATYSVGPSNELLRGSISRTLEVGIRPDSRIPYHVVQLIGLRKGAYNEVAAGLLAPWNFSHRGPLASLAVSPIVLVSGANISAGMPDNPWTPFDGQGFAAYRIAMIVLGATSLLVIFALARLFLNEEWSMFAFFVAAAAPFTIHELFFTWPKLIAACFVLLSAYFIKRRHDFAAGSAMGLGYLCHPSALLWVPAILLTVPLFDSMRLLPRKTKILNWGKRMAVLCAGLALWMLIWRQVNRGHFEQSGFLSYFREAGLLPATIGNWLWFRVVTALKTLVPFYIFLFHRTDPDLVAVEGTPHAWVQFVQQYWCSLAFAAGFVFYLVLLRLTVTASRKATLWMVLVFLPSLTLFIVYFGAPNTGLMREGMHAWFLGFVVFAIVVWNRHLCASKALWRFATAALVFRGLETMCVLVPFASWSRGYLLQPPFQPSDLCSLAVMVAGSIYLAAYAAMQCRSLAPSSINEMALSGALRQIRKSA